MPAPSNAESARIKVEDVSPVFRVLSEKADEIKLSDPQKKLLIRLEAIVRDGIYWVSVRRSVDAAPIAGYQISKTSAEFVKQAERVALFGILMEEQAGRVRRY